jgi:hypothetical protein
LLDTQTDLQPLIESIVLDSLHIQIIDLQDYTDKSIPDGYPRFQVYRCGRSFGTVCTWGEKYHTRIINNLAGYLSLYQAVTCWITAEQLKLIEQKVESEIVIARNLLPDYM